MRLFFSLPLLGVCASEVSGVQFVNPPPGGTPGDFSLNVVYTIGSTIDIQWKLGALDNTQLSLVVYQATSNIGFDYILPNANAGTTTYSWIVQTDKDLSVTHAFFFSIFMAGVTTPAANSHYFNITAADVVSVTTSSTTSTSSTSSAGTTSSTSTTSSISLTSSKSSTSSTTLTSPASSIPLSSLTSSSTNTGTSTTTSITETTISTTTVPASKSSGLSTGAKVSLGVGVPIAVILGLAAGWFFFGRRRMQDVSASARQSGAYHSSL